MLNWFRRRQRSQAQPSRRSRLYRPRVEGLEDRTLLAAPVINPISAVAVPSGKSILVPVMASHDDAGPDAALSYSVSSNSTTISAQVLPRGTYLQMTVAGFGDLIFELFPDRAPRTVATITGLAKAGFYDGLTFHRIVSNFVIQGGDPNGNGSGGPPGANATAEQRAQFQFNDEFNRDLIYTGTGLLAMAKSDDDTNGSQFFVTINPARNLDFNHTIFGQLVRGYDVLDRIRSVAVTNQDPANPSSERSRPISPPVITSVRVVEDLNDAVVLVTAMPNATGSATLTVLAADGNGTPATRTFAVTAAPDPAANNTPPFLDAIADQVTPVDQAVTFAVTGTDLEGDALTFEARFVPGTPVNGVITINGNQITVTPNAGFTGRLQIQVGVTDASHSSPSLANSSPLNPYLGDTQIINIGVGGNAISASAQAVSATEGTVASNVTVATFSNGDGSAVPSAFTATISWGDGNVSTGAITGTGGNFTVTGTNTYRQAGRYPVRVTIQNNAQGNSMVVFGTATIADATLAAADGAALTVARGTALNNVTVATFSDANPNGRLTDYTATIDWGDGTTSAGTITQGTGGVRNVVGSHTYATAGTFTAKAMVSSILPADDAGVIAAASASANSTVTVTAAVPQPFNNMQFVQQLYRDLLGREADDGGLTLLTSLLNSGSFRPVDAVGFLVSSEAYHTRQVNLLYNKYLGRDADTSGSKALTKYLQNGGTIENVARFLVSSDEYFQRAGGTNDGLLRTAYRDLFNREIDAGGLDTYTRAFAAGATRQAVVAALMSSDEFYVNEVNSLYQAMLGRTPDPSGADTFLKAFKAGGSFQVMSVVIALSDEYSHRV